MFFLYICFIVSFPECFLISVVFFRIMAENPRMRFGRPSQTTSVRRERAEQSRRALDASTSAPRSRLAHASLSRDNEDNEQEPEEEHVQAHASPDTQAAELRATMRQTVERFSQEYSEGLMTPPF